MKKLCLLFAVLFIAVSILPFTVAAASDESVGKIKIYISEYASVCSPHCSDYNSSDYRNCKNASNNGDIRSKFGVHHC